MKIPIDPFKTYVSPAGREFKVVGVYQLSRTKKWIKRKKRHWYEVEIVFLDDNSRIIATFDYRDNYVRKKALNEETFEEWLKKALEHERKKAAI